jgi:hypothetical protein
LTKSLKANRLTPFRGCKKCGEVCGPKVTKCPKCLCPYLKSLTVEELEAKADADGKIRAFSMELPKWPYEGAWQIVDAKKEGGPEDSPQNKACP